MISEQSKAKYHKWRKEQLLAAYREMLEDSLECKDIARAEQFTRAIESTEKRIKELTLQIEHPRLE